MWDRPPLSIRGPDRAAAVTGVMETVAWLHTSSRKHPSSPATWACEPQFLVFGVFF